MIAVIPRAYALYFSWTKQRKGTTCSVQGEVYIRTVRLHDLFWEGDKRSRFASADYRQRENSVKREEKEKEE